MGNSNTGVREKRSGSAEVESRKSFKMTGRHWTWVCIGILFLLTVVQFASFIFSDKMLVASDQLGAIDSKLYLSNSLFHYIQFPTWFSSRLSGMPTVDALFGDAMYPPSVILSSFLSVFRLFGYKMILHVFLAGVFFFFMLRRSFNLSRKVSLTGAIIFMLNPQFVSHVYPGHDGKMYVIAWLPFIVWRLRSLLDKPTIKNASVLGLGIAMTILTSHIQMSYFVLWGVFLYWLLKIVITIKVPTEKALLVPRVAYFWIAVFFGLGLSFIQFFPSFMYVREAFSVRGIDRGFEHATSWSMHWAEVFSLWVPEFGNSLQYYWGKNPFKLNTEYAGAIPVLLSVLAIVSKPKSIWRLFWGGIAVLAVLYALGAETPLFNLFYHLIPGVKKFRAPSMIMFWFSFSAVLLSVYFLKDLVSGRFEIKNLQAQKKWTQGLLISLGVITLITFVFSSKGIVGGFAYSMMGQQNAPRIFDLNFTQKFLPFLWLWWLFSSVVLVMLVLVVNGKIDKRILYYSLLIVGLIDAFRVNSQFIQVESQWKHYYRPDSVIEDLQSEFRSEPFRVFALPGALTRQQNQEGVYGLEGVGGFHDNELRCYREFRGDQGDRNFIESIIGVGPDGQAYLDPQKINTGSAFLDLANVRYVLHRRSDGLLMKIRNNGALGRLSFASNYVVSQEDKIVNDLKTSAYDYKQTVSLLEPPVLPYENGKAKNISSNAELEVKWIKYTPNIRIAQVKVPENGFIRLSEVFYPGWKIKVDDVETKYYRSDITWIAIPVKAGTHVLKMEPKSLYLEKSAMVSAGFFFLLLMIWIWDFRMKAVRRKPGN